MHKRVEFQVKHIEDKKAKKNRMLLSPADSKTQDLINTYSKMKIDSDPQKIVPQLAPDDKLFYLDRENQSLIYKYGSEMYSYSKDLENAHFNQNYLSRHKIHSEVRTKMIDWMIEVLHAYHSDEPTIFLAVHLLDLYIARSRDLLSDNDVHLTGIVCIYIASKMEDLVPLRMTHIKTKIGHNKFSERKIREKEKNILETINFEIIATSTYDFIKTFIFDFRHNNIEVIRSLNMSKHLESFENICLFLSKMMFHNEDFTQYRYSLKAIACIIAAFDILRSHSRTLSTDSEGFMKHWVRFNFNF
jgi:hypothetical protein